MIALVRYRQQVPEPYIRTALISHVKTQIPVMFALMHRPDAISEPVQARDHDIDLQPAQRHRAVYLDHGPDFPAGWSRVVEFVVRESLRAAWFWLEEGGDLEECAVDGLVDVCAWDRAAEPEDGEADVGVWDWKGD